ncbi:hypothetical protein C461_11974 [Halorubrum aidingense JCM 13560]|uniref:Uncharacterized protein n=1 Tax=Halorubrum aidingense JCM 13560 TaxID=1230454 RepID=M0P8J2_9EURY|nr:hypothetical protein C461_11974 [Halorubrum aidingense JCM 13560]
MGVFEVKRVNTTESASTLCNDRDFDMLPRCVIVLFEMFKNPFEPFDCKFNISNALPVVQFWDIDSFSGPAWDSFNFLKVCEEILEKVEVVFHRLVRQRIDFLRGLLSPPLLEAVYFTPSELV